MNDPNHGFTARSILVGLFVGGILCCSNMYFGLQSGWVTMGSIQSALLGFGFFRVFQRCGFGQHFTVSENAIIQTTSVAVATMPITAGFVSVIPALSMLTVDDNPPDGAYTLSHGKLILWTLAVAFFGAFTALPLRHQSIIKEKLKFPTGAATAKVIELLHQKPHQSIYFRLEDEDGDLTKTQSGASEDDVEKGLEDRISNTSSCCAFEIEGEEDPVSSPKLCSEAYQRTGNWTKALPILLLTFSFALIYKTVSEYVRYEGDQILAEFHVFSWIGLDLMTHWTWTLYPASGYIGQGMIMGPKTCISMFLGCFMGFGVLGPIAKSQSWAPGEITNLEDGAAGWVLWVSLAIMLGESLTSLILLTLKTSYQSLSSRSREVNEVIEDPNEVPGIWWIVGFGICTIGCVLIVSPMFSMAFYQPLIAVVLAAFVAILAVRALGETDLNPASGIGKISQIVFSVLAPGKVVANIVAGAIAEAGAIQAGDLMQDFKTAYLLGVPPRPQFFAQLIGSFVSVFLSVGVYGMYKIAWEIPGEELKAPSANVWLDMARLFNGGSLPEKVWLFALIFAILAAILVLLEQIQKAQRTEIGIWIPSGIGFAIGMYLGPKFTIPRLIGCGIERLWLKYHPSTHGDLMIVVASGFVLGEGTGAILIAFIKMLDAIY